MKPYLFLLAGLLVTFFQGLYASVINCGFEDASICGYVHDATARYQFRRNSGSTISDKTGPSSSSEGVWYMYLETSVTYDYKPARLESPEEDPVFKKCLKFSYHMYGSHIWMLKVMMKTSSGFKGSIWRQVANQGNSWHTQTVEITSFEPFRIVFEAWTGNGHQGDIAIDDVKLEDCPSSANTSVSFEPWTKWRVCNQTCGASYRSRARFWYSPETRKPLNFTYHVRYSTAEEPCPEEHRWYLDNLKNGSFGDEHGKSDAVVVSGEMDIEKKMLMIKDGKDSVKISLQEDTCILGRCLSKTGFTLAFWIHLNTQLVPGNLAILSSNGTEGLKMVVSDFRTLTITMDTERAKWTVNSSFTQIKWIYMTVTWSECFGLTYYENGELKKYSALFQRKFATSGVQDSPAITSDAIFIGKSPFAQGAEFSMIELVLWTGELSPADIKLFSRRVDQTERFGFFKPVSDSSFEWTKGYSSTPSNDTGPTFTHLQSEFDFNQPDYQPGSCADIKYMRKGSVDGHYVIYPRGSCGDALNVYCANMNRSSPEEYIDVDPALNYGIRAGYESPCSSGWDESGKTIFNKVRFFPDTMTVGTEFSRFTTTIGHPSPYGAGGACYSAVYDPACSRSGHFEVNLNQTGLRVKPTVKWLGHGVSDGSEILVNFSRSPDGQHISGDCGGYCGLCRIDGALVLELITCVKKKPSSCLDIKVYHNITEDGNFTIYPWSAALSAVRVFCAYMASTSPEEYLNVNSDGKNYGSFPEKIAKSGSCTLSTTSAFPYRKGLSRYAKVRLYIDERMKIDQHDDGYAQLVFGDKVEFGSGGSCYQKHPPCLPQGYFNIDLTGTGIGVSPSVAWKLGGWPQHYKLLYTVERGMFGQVIDGNCGSWCGSCAANGVMFVDVLVPYEKNSRKNFGEQNASLLETTDRGWHDRRFGLSAVCSVAVGCADGTIPNQSFSASSYKNSYFAHKARLHGSVSWRPQQGTGTDCSEEWIQVDMLLVRLVTGVATQGRPSSSPAYVTTYTISYGFDGIDWLTYFDTSKRPHVFQGNIDTAGVVKHDLSKPMFARYVRFSPLTAVTECRLRLEIYICPRASYHHLVKSGHYLFVESSYPRRKGDRAEMTTRLMPPTYRCMQFWYHMTGDNMGRLDVYVQESGHEKNLTWAVAGDDGIVAWKKAVIPLSLHAPFRVYIAGIVGDGYRSDIAVGGLSFMTERNCSIFPPHAPPQAGNICKHCLGSSDCDPITAKCNCSNKDFAGKQCENTLAETVFKDALHYWSFDSDEIVDLKTGLTGEIVGTIKRVPGPVNQAVQTIANVLSGIEFGTIQYHCLENPSLCASGLTIAVWLKFERHDFVQFFHTATGNYLGVMIISVIDDPAAKIGIQGTNHKCWMPVNLPEFVWSFLCVTWSISSDGTGELNAYYNGVASNRRTCYVMSPSFQEWDKKVMKTNRKADSSYTLDELAVWNHSLPASRVMEIYNNITANSITLRLKLDSYCWHMALQDEEHSEWRAARENINQMMNINGGNVTIKNIWTEFEGEDCLYRGFKKSGTVFLLENATLQCSNVTFDVYQDLFHLELTVNGNDARVRLNNIALGTVESSASGMSVGGLMATTQAGGVTVLVKDYHRNPIGNSSLFTYDNCDMTRSGMLGQEYHLYGSQASGHTAHCLATTTPLFSRSYRVQAQLYHVSGEVVYSAPEASHMGILFDYKSSNDFDIAIIRADTPDLCYTLYRMVSGVLNNEIAGTCPSGFLTRRTWNNMTVVVRPDSVKVYVNGNFLVAHSQTYELQPVKVGFGVYCCLHVHSGFKDFIVIDESQFESLSNFTTSRPLYLPSPINAVENAPILAVVEGSGSPGDAYSVSATFLYTTDYSFFNAGTSSGIFGICFNVQDEDNFDFVYYRRKKTVFADALFDRVSWKVTWQANEIMKRTLETSSFTLLDMTSMKVPMHVPFNTTAFPVNKTSMNVSWNWIPDEDVSGLFQGFKVLYRHEDDPEDSWKEQIVFGREFDPFSVVEIKDLYKGAIYFFKVVAFSLAGDGWPGDKVFNSTFEDVPFMVDLNITLLNVDLQTVSVHWDPLPKIFANGKLLGYTVVFQELNATDDQSDERLSVSAEQNNATHEHLKHFTSYNVTVLAFNGNGVSSATKSAVITTIDHVPAIFPPNISVQVLNTSAMTVSWDPIEDFLWQGFPVGYVLYYNHSGDLHNFNVSLNTLELTIINLETFTLYDIIVAGQTKKGLGPKSEIFTRRTHEEVPPVPPSNVRVAFLPTGPNLSCVFAWDPVPAGAVRGIIRGYKATYEPLDVLYLSDCSPPCPPLTNVTVSTNSSSINVSECLWNTNYSFSVLAYTVGDGVSSTTLYGTSPEGAPRIFPPNVSVMVLNTSALTVSWEHIDDILWQGVSVGYVIHYNRSNDDIRNFTVSRDVQEHTITNLTAFTVYALTVTGFTKKGQGPQSPTIICRTNEEAPKVAPVNIRINNQSTSEAVYSTSSNNTTTLYAVTLEWNPVPENQVRGIIRGYKVTYEPVEVYYMTRARRSISNYLHPVTVNTSTWSIRLDDLLFYTNYTVSVLAYTVDDGISSSLFHFTTPEDAPSEGPPNLRAGHEGVKSKLTVVWDSIPLHARNGILKGYHIYYKKSSSSGALMNLTVGPSVTKVLITNLETFTVYDVSVCGFTIVRDGVCATVAERTRSYDLAPYTAPWEVSTSLDSPRSIRLSWNPFPESYWYEYPRGYRISFQRVAFGGSRTSGDKITMISVGYTTASYSLSGLTYYTKYKFEISTITFRGFGPTVIIYGDTCNCPNRMTTAFRLLPPYVMKSHGALRGIIPELINGMSSSCCVPCFNNNSAGVDFNEDGHGNPSVKTTPAELLNSIDQITTFAFPIYGSVDQTHYYATHGFIPGVQSPGMVVIVRKQSPGDLATAVVYSILGIWPILVINIILACIAGVIMWILESSSNTDVFPRTCIRGCLEGFWWAFVTMTTVGYGDTTAKSVPGRIFAVVWILTSLCTTSILVGDLSSALSVVVSVSETALYGSKQGWVDYPSLYKKTTKSARTRQKLVEDLSPRRSSLVRRPRSLSSSSLFRYISDDLRKKPYGGEKEFCTLSESIPDFSPYYTIENIQEALLSGEVDAAVIDIYTAGLTKNLWNHTDLRISQILDYSATYGVVFSGDTYGVQHCFRRYMHENQIKILEIIEKYTETLQSIKTEDSSEYIQSLIDVQSSAFRRALLMLCVSLGVACFLGIVWNFVCRHRRSSTHKKGNTVHPVEPTEKTLGKDLNNFCSGGF